MKILMLTPYLPFPPSSGGQIRSYNLIKYLSEKHEITLFSLIKDDSEKKNVSELKKYCKRVEVFKRSKNPWTIENILKTGFGTYPFLVIRNLVPAEKRALEMELKTNTYDIIHAETFYAMPHIPKTDIPVLLVDQTIEYLVYKHYVDNQTPLFLKPLLYIDVFKLMLWEKTYWQRANKVVAVSDSDKKEMVKLAPKLDIGIVPNGVSLDFFKVRSTFSSKNPRVLFVANFKWLQNTEAGELLLSSVFPEIKARIPGAKLWIVGQHIPNSIKKQSSKDVVVEDLSVDDEKGIQRAYFESSVFVSPLRGPGGTRLKHFAAMASKLPLITTKVGAEGLGATNGTHLVIRNTPKEIAEATCELLLNPKRAQEIADAARDFVVQNYAWQIMAKKLDAIYEKVVHESKS